MKFTPSHEWIRVEKETASVGITAFAQKELGEIVYLELPKVGAKVKMGDEVCVLESTKAAADIYAPASGTIEEVNGALKEHLGWLNQDPEEKGWLFKLALDDPKELDLLLDHQGYKALTE